MMCFNPKLTHTVSEEQLYKEKEYNNYYSTHTYHQFPEPLHIHRHTVHCEEWSPLCLREMDRQ